jgi:hypothetical protein
MPYLPHLRALARSLLLVAIVLMGASLTRGITAELNSTLGTKWPFSLAHCHVAVLPGCDAPRPSEWHEATR